MKQNSLTSNKNLDLAKNPPHRPLLFNDPKEILSLANAYFKRCNQAKIPYTITGLSLALGMTRETLFSYIREKAENLSRAAKWALTVVEESIERRALSPNNAGAQFILRAGFGWKDQMSGGDINIFSMPETKILHLKQVLNQLYAPTASQKYTAILRPSAARLDKTATE